LLSNALIFLLQTLLNFLTVLFLLRLYFQLIRISFQSPFGQLVVSLTNFAVKPARRILPSIGKWDVATLLLAFTTQWLLAAAVLWLKLSPLLSIGSSSALLAITGSAIIGLCTLIIFGFVAAVLLHSILSWVHPYSPAMPFLAQFTNPIMRHFRKWVPLVGNVDLSPLVFIVVAQFLLYLLNALEQTLHANLVWH